MNIRVFCILFFLIMITGLAFGQEKAVVFDFQGVGVDASTIEAASHIFRSELSNTGQFIIIEKQTVEAALAEKGIEDFSCFAVECASEYGYIAGAEKAIIGSLTKLGSKLTTEVRVISVVRKEVVFTDRYTATSLDDLEVTLRRLAEAIAAGEQIQTETTRFTVTEEEAVEPRRKKAFITSGFSLNGGFPIGDSYSGIGQLFGASWVIRYEAENWVLENSLGFYSGTGGDKDTVYNVVVNEKEIAVMPWDIGLRYVFNRKSDFTPFVGGGLGLHFIGTQKYGGDELIDNDQAFAFHLAGGFYGFQSYDFRLGIELKYTLIFTDAFIDSGDNSHMIGLSISVTRKFDKGDKRGCMSGGCLF